MNTVERIIGQFTNDTVATLRCKAPYGWNHYRMVEYLEPSTDKVADEYGILDFGHLYFNQITG